MPVITDPGSIFVEEIPARKPFISKNTDYMAVKEMKVGRRLLISCPADKDYHKWVGAFKAFIRALRKSSKQFTVTTVKLKTASGESSNGLQIERITDAMPIKANVSHKENRNGNERRSIA